MCEKREPSSIIAARLSFSIACPVMVILCFTALSTKTEAFPGFWRDAEKPWKISK